MSWFRFSWSALFVAAAWGFAGMVAWQAWGPVPQPIEFTGKVSYSPEPVVQGESLTVWREFIVREPVTLVVTRNLVPVGLGADRRPTYHMPESRALWKSGRYDNPRAHEIPAYVQPGRYRFDTVATWRVNRFREETKSLDAVEFTVVAR